MEYTRLYTGSNDQSHFETCSFALDEAPIGHALQIPDISSLVVGEIKNPEAISWHNAPVRQYIVMLKGSMEIEVGSGEKKLFQVGDILLAEDLMGQGHITRSVDGADQAYLAIPLNC